MAVEIVSGKKLNYTAGLDIEQALKSVKLLKKEFATLGVDLPKAALDTKGMTTYQAGLLKIKQDTLDFAKVKAEQAKADKSASLATQEALKQERLLIQQRNAEAKKSESALSEEKKLEALLKLKKEQLDFAKLKNDQARADKSASEEVKKAINEERLLIIQKANELKAITLEQKKAAIAAKEAAAVPRKVNIGNSVAEAAAYNSSTTGTNGKVNTAFTSYLQSVKKSFEERKISQKAYVEELERYSIASVQASKNTNTLNKETQSLTLSKKGLIKDLAIEKLRHAENTAALKNSAREYINEKGSIEQRRAALIRLTAAYDKLSAAERNSGSGQRLNGIVSNLSSQVKTLEAETGRAQRNVGNYTSAFSGGLSKVWSGLKTVANILPGVGLAGLLGFALGPIIDYISQLDIFKGKANALKDANRDLAEKIGDAGSAAAKATLEVADMKNKFQEARDGIISKELALKTYNEGIGKTLGFTNDLNVAESRTIKNGDAFVEMMFKKAKAASLMALYTEQMSKAAVELAKSDDDAGDYILSGTKGKGLKDNKGNDIFEANAKRNKETAAKVFEDKAKVFKELFLKTNTEIDKFSKKNNLIVDGDSGKINTKSTENAIKAAVKAQRDLQASIDEMIDKSKRKKLDADQEEIENIKAGYKVKLDQAKIYNLEVEKFNADKKNKFKKTPVDAGGLLVVQDNDIKAALYRQETALQAVEFEKQKGLFADYENYKTTYGEVKAKERFGKIKSNADLINQLEKEVQEFAAKAAFGSLKEVEKDRFNVKAKQLGEMVKQEDAASKDRYLKAFEAAKGANDRILDLQKQHNADVSALGESATKEQLDNLNKNLSENISKVSLSDLMASDEWVKLFSDLDTLTVSELDNLIKVIEGKSKELGSKLNPVDVKAVVENLQKVKDEILSRNPFTAVGVALKAAFNNGAEGAKESSQEISKDWLKLGETTEAAFGFIENAINSCDLLKDAIGEVGQQSLSSLASIVKSGIAVTAAITAASSASTAVALAGSAAVKTAEKASVILAVISAALAVIQAISAVLKSVFAANDKKIEKSITGHKEQVELLTDAYNDLERAVNSAIGESIYQQQQLQIQNLQAQQAKIVQMRKAEESKKKSDQGKINEYKQQEKEAAQQIIDINNQIAESLIQTNFKDLSASFADALTDAFKTAGDAGEAFDKVFNQTIANAIKNSLKLRLLEPVIAEFTTALADFAKNNNNSVIGFPFEAYRKKLKDAADLYSQGIAASGDFFKDATVKQEDKFLKSLGESFLKSLETGEYAKKVAEYHKRVAEATAKGLTTADIAALKLEYDALSALAKIKMDDYKKLTGQEIVIDPITLTFSPPDPKTLNEGAKAIGDKLFDLLTKSAEETGLAIGDILEQQILEALKAEIITDALKPLADKVKALYKDGKIPTKSEIEAATAEMNAFIANARLKLKDIESITGLTFGDVVKDSVGGAVAEMSSELKSLSDSILGVFANTDNALADFESKWNGLVENTILERLRKTTLEGRLTEFYNEFQKLDKVEDSKKAEQLALLKLQYDSIIKGGQAEFERLQKIFGVDLNKPVKQDQSAISSSIGRSITEDTANVLSGTFLSINEQVTRSNMWLAKAFQVSTQALDAALKTEQNTRRAADSLDGVPAKLDQIISNTATAKKSGLVDSYMKLTP